MGITSCPDVVLFGGSGFVGAHVRSALRREGRAVTVVSRRSTPTHTNERLLLGSLSEPERLVDTLPPGGVIINLAYAADGGRDANLRLADGLASICRLTAATRLVHVSTAMVAGLAAHRVVNEATPCRPRNLYQNIKLEVECRLAASVAGTCPLVVLRPTAVFGAGGRNLSKLIADSTERPWVENYLRACLFGRRSMNLVPVETVAAAVLFGARARLEHPVTTWIVADDEDPANNYLDVEQVIHNTLAGAPRRFPVVPLPLALLYAALKLTGRLSYDPRSRFASDALARAGFVRPVSFGDALAAYARRVRDGHVKGGSLT